MRNTADEQSDQRIWSRGFSGIDPLVAVIIAGRLPTSERIALSERRFEGRETTQWVALAARCTVKFNKPAMSASWIKLIAVNEIREPLNRNFTKMAGTRSTVSAPATSSVFLIAR